MPVVPAVSSLGLWLAQCLWLGSMHSEKAPKGSPQRSQTHVAGTGVHAMYVLVVDVSAA